MRKPFDNWYSVLSVGLAKNKIATCKTHILRHEGLEDAVEAMVETTQERNTDQIVKNLGCCNLTQMERLPHIGRLLPTNLKKLAT